ncbi:MAG: BspA family leucine-rich repeat surface protein, partial [Romboutsia timonensis]|uniref:BspA family leucine-rich repeat surface protein n=1 Tax=Romboutsia timonensis TaxID=1776391 RepID=UPI002A74D4EB
LDLSNWNTSAVTDMQGMFCGTDKLNFIDLRSFQLQPSTNTNNMFSISASTQQPVNAEDKFLVLVSDDKLAGYNFEGSNRAGSKLTFNSGDGSFSDTNPNDNIRYSQERFVIKADKGATGEDLIKIVEKLVSEDIEKMNKPTKSGYEFDKWVLKAKTKAPQTKTSVNTTQNNKLTPEQITKILEKLNGVYEASWISTAINVTVPTTIPFQVVTNLMDKNEDQFISGVLKFKNNNTVRKVKVSVGSFTKDANSADELELVDPTKTNIDWDTLSSEDTMRKMALGMYVKSGFEGNPTYVKNSPLWLKPDEVNNIELGIIPEATDKDNPSEAKLSFTSEHGKNFIGGRAKGKFKLTFIFENIK